MSRSSIKSVPKAPAPTGTQELLDMLAFRRPAWSKTEEQFISRFIEPLEMQQDMYGNLYKRIGDAPVLWSAHTDTVAHFGGKQALRVSAGIVGLDDERSNCLGADDTAGCWLLMEMIRAQRPGLYIFHRAEEIGGRGSSDIALRYPELLEGMKFAIAFDRKGHTSVITHQGARCCSDAFGLSLAAALGMKHTLDTTGSFTDTANYTHLIGECTNVSVGYLHEHSKRETLDLNYVLALRHSLLALDVSSLVFEREPGAEDDWLVEWDDADQQPRTVKDAMLSLVTDHPFEVAEWLEEYGITAEEVEEMIWQRGGVVRRQRR